MSEVSYQSIELKVKRQQLKQRDEPGSKARHKKLGIETQGQEAKDKARIHAEAERYLEWGA